MRHSEHNRRGFAVARAVTRRGDEEFRRAAAREEIAGDVRDGPSDGLPRVGAWELHDRQASTLQVEFLVHVGNRDAQVCVPRARPRVELNRKHRTKPKGERVSVLLELLAHLLQHNFAQLEQDVVKCVRTALLHVPVVQASSKHLETNVTVHVRRPQVQCTHENEPFVVSFPFPVTHVGQLGLQAERRRNFPLATSVASERSGPTDGRRRPLPRMMPPHVFVAVAGVPEDHYKTTYLGPRRVERVLNARGTFPGPCTAHPGFARRPLGRENNRQLPERSLGVLVLRREWIARCTEVRPRGPRNSLEEYVVAQVAQRVHCIHVPVGRSRRQKSDNLRMRTTVLHSTLPRRRTHESPGVRGARPGAWGILDNIPELLRRRRPCARHDHCTRARAQGCDVEIAETATEVRGRRGVAERSTSPGASLSANQDAHAVIRVRRESQKGPQDR
mmetsp:Transcript_7139/g.29529  ORF Transcript_7139/g.29529 Transcript_7139/m.29529 type:complete len:446 (-) Transcript_7139:56-1393(-)